MSLTRKLAAPFAASLLIAGVTSASGVGLAGSANAAPRAAAVPRAAVSNLRPIIFVHGILGSGAQWETQARRFASNGYPASYIEDRDYDSFFTNETQDQVFAKLDAQIARLKAATGATQVDLAAHSLGTSEIQTYLRNSASRAANVAHYINIDGVGGSDLPGGVPTLALWGSGQPSTNLTGATNVHLDDETHVETTNSIPTFVAAYKFLTGTAPATTDVVAQPGTIQLAGRAVSFPSNVGLKGNKLAIYTLNPATGQRSPATPIATPAIDADGAFGPVNGVGTAYYEFALTRPDGSIHHVYYEPFRRTDLGIRLLSTDPGTGLEALIDKSAASTAFVVIRNMEFWGDQAAPNLDTLKINGTSILNATTAPKSKLAIALAVYDAGTNKATNLATVPGLFGLLPFLGGVDLYIPSTPTGTGTVTLQETQRHGSGRVHTLVIPNYPSDKNLETVNLDDFES
jgi:hypothetical protein